MLNDRKARLKVLNENENGVDNALLFDGPQPFTIHRPPGFDGHILEVLASFVRGNYDMDVLREIDSKVVDRNWLRQPFPPHKNVRFLCSVETVYAMLIVKQDTINYKTEPGDDEELARLSFLKHISDNFLFLPTDFHNYPENQQVWDQLKHTFRLLDRLRLLIRFIDRRNHETAVVPLPDGSNLESGSLRMCWVLHRAWIRALHYRTLYVGEQNHGWLQIMDILRLVLAFHEAENDEVRHEGCQIPPEFDFMRHIWDSVVNALKGFSASLFEECRPIPLDCPFTSTQTLANNTRPDTFRALWSRVRVTEPCSFVS